MINLWLNVEVSAGASIENTCNDAAILASRLGVLVVFRFNGVKCFVRPGEDPQEVAERWARTIENATLGT